MSGARSDGVGELGPRSNPDLGVEEATGLELFYGLGRRLLGIDDPQNLTGRIADGTVRAIHGVLHGIVTVRGV
jgi:hypothetical protein